MRPSNKHHREQITQRKFRSRLVAYNLHRRETPDYAFKQQGKPCSCVICKKRRYKRQRFAPEKE